MAKLHLGRIVALCSSALAVAACSPGPGTATGAAGGVVAGAVVGGPVGAVVGGVAGGAVGATLTGEEIIRTRQVVVTEHRPVARVGGTIVVGSVLPSSVVVYPVPASARLHQRYDYAYVNNHYVLVRPGTRQVVTVMD